MPNEASPGLVLVLCPKSGYPCLHKWQSWHEKSPRRAWMLVTRHYTRSVRLGAQSGLNSFVVALQ